MEIHSGVSVHSIDQLTVETVFSCTLGGNRCLCILLDKAPQRYTVAVLSDAGSDEHYPYWVELNRGIACLSYGTACILEPIVGPESTPRSKFDHAHKPGVLTMDQDGGLSMYFRPFSALQDEIAYDFARSEFSSPSHQDFAAFRKWRLWRSAEDRMQKDATPLYTFDLDKVLPSKG